MLGLLRRQPQLLTERQDALRERVRAALVALREALAQFGADVAPADVRTLDEAIAHLEELFLLVIAGEFNSGKSSFINALLGDTVVAEGVTPTTDRITLLRHSDEPDQRTLEEFLVERRFPAEVLRSLVVVDTPGTNAIIRRHEELTRDFIPRSDLVLFVTSADRPFTESERAFLEAIREWGKKIVFVLNKVDLLETEQERQQVVAFIRENVRDLLGFTPEIFPVSARLAKRARAEGDEGLWRASQFEAMERYILETLDEEERVRLKLLSPLGVARRLADKYLHVVEGRLATLQHDVAMLENIERQLELFRGDLANDFQYHQTEVENTLNEFELRAMRFFDETIRVPNIPRLVRDQNGIRAQFEREVVDDLPQQIESRVQGLIDWMIEKNLRLWQSTTEYLRRERVQEHRSGIIGDVGGSFEYNRAALIDSVARRAQQVVASYDREAESQALAEEVRAAIAGTALVGAGALGLGALLVALLHTAALDVTGILAAGVVAVGGLYLIPNKRRQVKRQFHERVAELREQLLGTMRRQFETELEQMVARIREAIAPYTRFIRAQQVHLIEVQRALSDVDVDLGRIRAEIGD
ncbi:MAG TPA: dynamin family protein [Roseiflexaceae bacterium]|nr:dynamin family protein [Roseiflexaceae bacterium]